MSTKTMNRWSGKVAFVTGASSGIGAAIAETLVKEGMLVVGLARRSDQVEKMSASLAGAKGKLYARRCDVSKEEELRSAFEWVQSKLGGIDVLVNNAGFLKFENVLDDNVDSFRNIMDVNFMATAICLREAVISMQHRQVPGHIINISSIFGHPYPMFPVPVSVYGSSKVAVTTLSDTVRKQLGPANTRIKITNLSPGLVATEMTRPSENLDAGVFSTTPVLQSKDIADAVVYLLGTPENVQVTEFTIRPTGEVF